VTSFTVILRPLDYGTATRGNPGFTVSTSRFLVTASNSGYSSVPELKSSLNGGFLPLRLLHRNGSTRYNIKKDPTCVYYEGVVWIDLAEDTKQRRGSLTL
jgi:hypothetical protein